jgi:deazaflavin-dependent oxidoreductase (nitroreductase family)
VPMPSWWGQINKRVFNPWTMRNGRSPVIRHVGRSSGQQYRTPLDAHRVDDGFVFVLVYGSQCDWVQNVLAAGTATLEADGDTVDLVSPELITADEAFERLPPGTKRPPRLLKIDEFLLMRRAERS